MREQVTIRIGAAHYDATVTDPKGGPEVTFDLASMTRGERGRFTRILSEIVAGGQRGRRRARRRFNQKRKSNV